MDAADRDALCFGRDAAATQAGREHVLSQHSWRCGAMIEERLMRGAAIWRMMPAPNLE